MRINKDECTCLLVTAVLTACGGSAPESVEVPDGDYWFESAAEAHGIDFVHVSGAAGAFLMPEIMCGGVALFDAEGDGDLDLYCVQAGSLSEPARQSNQLYLNDGRGFFENVSAESGAADRGYGNGVATGDFDGDGDIDLYVTNYGANVLLRNDGEGRFDDVTKASGVGHRGWGTSCGFLDYDRDGDLDLFVCNYLDWNPSVELECFNTMGGPDYCSPRNYMAPQADVLYRNDGDGRFTDVSEAAGLWRTPATGLGLVVADFNQDGWPDVFVANDGMRDQLWINEQGAGFVDRAAEFGCAVDQNGRASAGMGVAAGDIDADGDVDLIVCNLRNEPDSCFRNEGGQRFTNTTAVSGLAAVSRKFTRFGMAWVDFDNDGWVDLFQANGRVMRQHDAHGDDAYAEPNLLFRGSSSGRFARVESLVQGSRGSAQVAATSRAAAFGDIDGDGGVDAVIVNRDGACQLLMNRCSTRGNWVQFDVLTAAGAPALGATLRARVGARELRGDVVSVSSYQAANSATVHLGLGSATEVLDVRVTWPSGEEQSFGRLDVNQRHVLTAGAGSSDR